MRERRWYTRFGVEPPFPWVLCAIWVGIGLTAEAALGFAFLVFSPWPDGLHDLFQ